MHDKDSPTDRPVPAGGNPGIKRSQKQPGQDIASDTGDDIDTGREQDGPGERPSGRKPRQPG